MANKEVTELIGEIRDAGYKVASSGRTHHVVLDKQGRRLVDGNGPVIISKTPSEHRWREMTVHRLIKAGVFKQDPRKADQKANGRERANKAGTSRLNSPEVQAAKVEAIKAKSRAQAQLTQELRGRLEPIIVKLGGWHEGRGGGGGVPPTELGRVNHYWLQQQGQLTWPTGDAAGNALGVLKRGGTLGEKVRPMVEAFVEELERQGENVRNFYFELVREMKGLPASQRIERDRPLALVPGEARGGDETEEEPATSQVEHAPAPPSVAVLSAGVPMLAMEAVYLMAQAPNADMAAVLSLGEKIARMEMGGTQ
jgi:hypothetical protein